jgi:cytochrome b
MKVRVWDIPTRLFHWSLVAAFAGAFFTSGTEWFLEYHTVFGYIALGLVIFRIVWGFAGNRYSRFSDFVGGWRRVREYLRQVASLKPPRYLGHNPAVGWVVLFMLLMTAALVATGIMTYSGEEGRGFWAGLVTRDTGIFFREIHDFLAGLAIAVIVIHVSAALFHDFILKENIILSMVTGRKEDPATWSERVGHMRRGDEPSALRLVALILAVILAGLGVRFLPPQERKIKFTGEVSEQVKVVTPKGYVARVKPDPKWKEECSPCHNAFHPTLLPAASWKRIMDGLNNHFGDDVSLDPAARNEILDYLVSSSAERSTTEASRKLLDSLKKGEAPLRITDIPYWKDKHSEISDDVFKKRSVGSEANCLACHPGAAVGSFEDKDIRVPD